MLVLVESFWIGITDAGLPTAGYADVEIFPTLSSPSTSWTMIALTSVGIALMTGAARKHVDGVQLFGSLWFAFWATFLVVATSGLEFFATPDKPCRNQGCWPQGYQELLIMTPVIGACVVMIVMSFLQKFRWRWRALVPAVTFMGLAVVQRLVWEDHILPLLLSPPS